MRRYALAIVLSLCLLLSTQLGCSPAHGQQVALYEEQAKTQRDLTDSESAARSGSTDTSREIERLETIARSFRKLPDEELARIGIDLDKPIVLGGEQAAALHKAWAVRQQEFKDMVDGMVKPAEHMASLARSLKTSNGTQEERTDALMELEGLLTDVDNARDFYTIGGWPVLLRALQPQYSSLEQRMLAAWCIGSAVKNNYDYQLWVLQSARDILAERRVSAQTAKINEHSPEAIMEYEKVRKFADLLDYDSDDSVGEEVPRPDGIDMDVPALDLLVELLTEGAGAGEGAGVGEEDAEAALLESARRRALYAIASSVRGNVEVQEALMRYDRSGNGTGIHPPRGPPQGPSRGAGQPKGEDADNQNAAATSTFYFSRQVLLRMVQANETSPELRRKAWNLVADMLEERRFVRDELAQATAIVMDGSQGEGGNDETMAMPKVEQEQLLEQIARLRLLGDDMCSTEWGDEALFSLRALYLSPPFRVLESMPSDDSFSADMLFEDDGVAHAGVDTNGDIDAAPRRQGSGPSSVSVSVSAEVTALRASLNSVMITLREIASQCPDTLNTALHTVDGSISRAASVEEPQGDDEVIREKKNWKTLWRKRPKAAVNETETGSSASASASASAVDGDVRSAGAMNGHRHKHEREDKERRLSMLGEVRAVLVAVQDLPRGAQNNDLIESSDACLQAIDTLE